MGSSSQTTEKDPWSPAQGHITGSLNWAQEIAQNMAGSTPQMGQVGMNSNLQNAWNQMGGQGMNDLAQQFGSQGASLMGQLGQLNGLYEQIGQGPNLYNQQSTRDALLKDQQGFLDNQNAAIMEGLDKSIASATGQVYGASAGQGNVGSSRTQLAVGQAAGDLSSNAQLQMSNLSNQAYNSAMNQAMQQEQSRMQGLQAQAAGIAGMGQMGSQMMGQAGNIYQQGMQNQLQAGAGQMAFDQQQLLTQYQNEMNAWMAPQNAAGWYAGMAQGAGALGGSTTVPIDRFGQFMQMAGQMGQGMGAAMATASDRRLKKNIKKLFKDKDLDLNIYSWDWNDEVEELIEEGFLDKAVWDENKIGVIAQECQEKYPEAIIEMEGTGWLMVDYGLLKLIKAENHKESNHVLHA